MAGEPTTTRATWKDLLEPLRAEPAKTAILTDFDGTLAPIVERAEDAALPGEARAVLERLIDRYGLVGAVSGRRAAEVRALVDVEGL
jgi:trehalose 6-phosphate phosphatase